MAWGLVMVKKKRENRPNISVGSVRAGEMDKQATGHRLRTVEKVGDTHPQAGLAAHRPIACYIHHGAVAAKNDLPSCCLV
jgi:hypothetical protein